MHFVEVKTRRVGLPDTARGCRHAAEIPRTDAGGRALPGRNGRQEEAQFDLAAVDVMPDGRMEVRLVEQAMEYNW